MQVIPVTVVVPVRNEEINLQTCLPKLGSYQEVLVVDSGSTDRTAHFAESLGAKVIQFRWDGQFPKKRNWILQNYAFLTEWVLFLDADEEMTVDFEFGVGEFDPEFKVFWILDSIPKLFLGRKLRFGVPQRKLALFKIGKGTYEKIDENRWSELDMEVHEHPIVNGIIGELRSPLIHRNFKTIHDFVEQHNEYSDWEARRFVALQKTTWGMMTTRQRLKYSLVASGFFPFAYFLFTYVLRAGFLDGRAGLDYAVLKFAYFHQINLKIRELLINHPPFNEPHGPNA